MEKILDVNGKAYEMIKLLGKGKGYMDKLMRKVIRDVKKQGRRGLVLTCKKGLISFYERFGFVNEGRSRSEHGGAQWFEMRLEF